MLINAKNGRAKVDSTVIGRLKNIQISTSDNATQITDSSVNGGKTVVAGNKDWNGSFEANGAAPIVKPGDTVTIEADAGNGNGYSGDCLVLTVSITVNLESADPVMYSVEFAANGVLTLGAVTVADDDAVTMPLSSKNAVLALADPAETPVYAEVPNWKSCEISLSIEGVENVDSGTDGQVMRLDGNKNVEVSFTMNVDAADISAVPAIGTTHLLRLTIGSAIWNIGYVYINNHGDITISPEDRSILQVSVETLWSVVAEYGDPATAVEGNVTAGSQAFHVAA